MDTGTPTSLGVAPQDISGAVTSVILRYVRSRDGDDGVAKTLALAGEQRNASELEDPRSWSTHAEAIALLAAAGQVTGDDEAARHVGEEMLRQHDGTDVADRLRRAVRTLVARLGAADSAAAVDVRAAGEVLAPLARRCGRDLDRFLTEISLGAEADALDPRADAVTLLTLHAAKGLEFEVVFLAGCEKGLLPLWLPGQGPLAGPELAEERRLLFVGITRARARLFLTCASRRTRHGSTRDAGASPFLAAIDPALLDRWSTALARPVRPASRQLRLL